MFEKINEIMQALMNVCIEYPKVFFLSIFYLVLIIGGMSVYFPLLNWLVNFEFFFNYPFREIILSNFDILRWGVVVFPLAIGFVGFFSVTGLYDLLSLRKYGR